MRPAGLLSRLADPVDPVHAARLVGRANREDELLAQTSRGDQPVRLDLDAAPPRAGARRGGVGDRHQRTGGDRDRHLLRLEALPDGDDTEDSPGPPQAQHTGYPREQPRDPVEHRDRQSAGCGEEPHGQVEPCRPDRQARGRLCHDRGRDIAADLLTVQPAQHPRRDDDRPPAARLGRRPAEIAARHVEVGNSAAVAAQLRVERLEQLLLPRCRPAGAAKHQNRLRLELAERQHHRRHDVGDQQQPAESRRKGGRHDKGQRGAEHDPRQDRPQPEHPGPDPHGPLFSGRR